MRSPRQFPETDAQRILSRAIELDAADGPRLSRTELESIARELGVRSEALDRAIVEADARDDEPDGVVTRPTTAWRLALRIDRPRTDRAFPRTAERVALAGRIAPSGQALVRG